MKEMIEAVDSIKQSLLAIWFLLLFTFTASIISAMGVLAIKDDVTELRETVAAYEEANSERYEELTHRIEMIEEALNEAD